MQAALLEKGVELSLEEVKAMGGYLSAWLESGKQPGELSLDELEEVAGGSVKQITHDYIIAMIDEFIDYVPKVKEKGKELWESIKSW